ncbi:MAG: prepilin peptidase [Acidobacteriaceae bacterium]|nr:prepilin peptidase [Acidobacteriaceae bacterium]
MDPHHISFLVNPRAVWIVAAIVGAIAGYTDYRWRRIPNWLTVPGLLLGIALNSLAQGGYGVRYSLVGAGLGLLILLPFVLIRSLGAGDWKLIGALGAFVGPHNLITVLFVTVVIAGLMALFVVIWKRRFLQTMRNIGGMLAAMMSLHLPGREVSLDNPESSKIPFGVAAAIAIVLFAAAQLWNSRR